MPPAPTDRAEMFYALRRVAKIGQPESRDAISR